MYRMVSELLLYSYLYLIRNREFKDVLVLKSLFFLSGAPPRAPPLAAEAPRGAAPHPARAHALDPLFTNPHMDSLHFMGAGPLYNKSDQKVSAMHVHCVPPQIRPDTRSPTKWHGWRPSGHTPDSLALVRGGGLASARETPSRPHPCPVCKVSPVDNLY